MKKLDKTAIIVLIIAGILIIGSFISSRFVTEHEVKVNYREHTRCVLEFDKNINTTRSLIVGYNYHLVEEYAEFTGQSIEISLTSHSKASYVDSLKAGSIDLLVMSINDALDVDSVLFIGPIDDVSMWLMRLDDEEHKAQALEWFESHKSRPDYNTTRDLYIQRFSPFRSGRREAISPYDSIIKVQADSIGIDWRLLAAVVYKESRFHIEARSNRGASGLMQMMPRTAKNHNVTDPLDPEENIRGGSEHLAELFPIYRRIGADNIESFKYCLAAYNAGVGRIRDVINVARSKDISTAYWENMVELVIPEMRDSSKIDTNIVRFGTFKGVETISYVDNIITIYEEFKRICP